MEFLCIMCFAIFIHVANWLRISQKEAHQLEGFPEGGPHLKDDQVEAETAS